MGNWHVGGGYRLSERFRFSTTWCNLEISQKSFYLWAIPLSLEKFACWQTRHSIDGRGEWLIRYCSCNNARWPFEQPSVQFGSPISSGQESSPCSGSPGLLGSDASRRGEERLWRREIVQVNHQRPRKAPWWETRDAGDSWGRRSMCPAHGWDHRQRAAVICSLWSHVRHCWPTIEYLVYQLVPDIDISRQIVNILLTILPQISILLLWSVGHRCRELILCRVVESSFLSTHNIVPHISWHDLPCHRTTKTYSDFPSMVIFPLLLRKFWIQTWFCNCPQYLCLFHIVFKYIPGTHDRGKMLVLPNQLLCSVLFTSDQCFVSFQPLMSPHTQIRTTLFSRCTNKHSQLETFSQPFFNRTFSNCLSHNSPAKRWPYRFRSRGTTGSSILDHDLGHLCRGRRIQMSGHSDLGIFNIFEAFSIFTWV